MEPLTVACKFSSFGLLEFHSGNDVGVLWFFLGVSINSSSLQRDLVDKNTLLNSSASLGVVDHMDFVVD